jgi:lysophospholipase L1-like esterase
MRAALAILALLLVAWPAQAAGPRVLILGDSLARGAYASQPGAAYAARVAAALGASETTVVRGDVVRLESAQAAWRVAGAQGWDIVVLEIGINDTLTPTIADADWATQYALLAGAIASGARLVCVTPFDVGGRAAQLATRAELIRQSCAGGSIADVWAATAGRAELRAAPGAATFYNNQGQGVADTLHPNDAGHAEIAAVILAALRHPIYLPALTR